jgi:hypothetical protein
MAIRTKIAASRQASVEIEHENTSLPPFEVSTRFGISQLKGAQSKWGDF